MSPQSDHRARQQAASTVAMSSSRVEAFSDGVIAIAITLLVLDIHVPQPGGPRGLAHGLLHEWPSYAAYVVSFLTIGVIWINHHAMLRRLSSVDHSFLALNLLLLMFIGLLPWSTSLMATYLREPHGQHLAAAVFGASFLAMSLAFFAIQHHVLRRNTTLLHPHITPTVRDVVYRRNRAGLLPYVVATAAAAVSSYLTLAICAVLAGFYALPSTTTDPDGDESP
jgi:uncharacterized membrane protein